MKVVAVVDLTAEYSGTPRLRDLAYLNVPVLDLTAPTPRQLNEALEFIDEHISSGKVYIHCALGYSRSAAVAAAYLLRRDRGIGAERAMEHIRACRRGAVLDINAVDALDRMQVRERAQAV